MCCHRKGIRSSSLTFNPINFLTSLFSFDVIKCFILLILEKLEFCASFEYDHVKKKNESVAGKIKIA